MGADTGPAVTAGLRSAVPACLQPAGDPIRPLIAKAFAGHSGGKFMKALLFALCGGLLLAASPCAAQVAAVPVRSLQLSKVILDTETDEVTGKLKGGTLCVFPSKLPLLKEKKTQDYERYDMVFAAELTRRGFRVVTASGDLFSGEDGKDKGDLLVGAVMRLQTLNICSSVNGEKGDVTLAIDWQIYDRATQKVVAMATTTGHAVQEKFARDRLRGMWNLAFVDSLSTLIESGAVARYAGAPVPPPAAAAPPAPPAPAPATK